MTTPTNGNGWKTAALGALGALLAIFLTLRVEELQAARRALVQQVYDLEQRVTRLEAKR